MLLVEEVDHHHVELLAVAVAAADALLDALRVPGQVVVHHQVAELEVDALGRGLGGDQDRRLVAEVLHQRGAHVGARRAGDAVGARVLLEPALVDRLRRRVGVRAVEEHDLARELGLLEHAEEILLRPPRLGEDHRLLLERGAALALLRLGRGREASPQRREQHLALGVLDDRPGQRVELAQLGHLLPQLGELLRRESRPLGWRGAVLVLFPLVGQLVQLFPVCRQLLRQRVYGFAARSRGCLQLAAPGLRACRRSHRSTRPAACAGSAS